MAKKAQKKPKKSRRKAIARKPAVVKRKKTMSNKPKPFPYHAAEARDQSAEEAAAIVRQAQAGLEEATDPGILKRLGRILASANVILRLLEGQGAKTRPAPSGKGVYVTDQREAAETFKKK